MRVRRPRIDFGQVRPQWAPIPEFAQHHNAASTIPVHVEPYLIRVLNRVRAEIDPSETALLADLDMFNKQESQHYRQHAAFNQTLYRAGYDKLLAFEQKLKDDLAGYLAERSLKFNLAYAEGFESMGPPSAAVWFEKSDPLLEGADPHAVDLWKWHMAEEFEHREICHKLFHHLYSRGPVSRVVNGWFYRVYGFVFAVLHLGRYLDRVSAYLIEVDRQSMTEAQLRESRLRYRKVMRAYRRNMLPRLALVLLPFYDPGRKRTPRDLMPFLKRFEEGGDSAFV